MTGAMSIGVSVNVFLEGTMLVCFGLAWPLATLGMLRARRSNGKGMAFTAIVLCGYLARAMAKLALTFDGKPLAPLFWLYVINAGSVGTNLALQRHFRDRTGQSSASKPAPRDAAFSLAPPAKSAEVVP